MEISAENTEGACPVEHDSRKIQGKEKCDTVQSYGLCRCVEEFTTDMHVNVGRVAYSV